MRITAFGNIQQFAAESLNEICVLSFGVNNDNIIISSQEHIEHFSFSRERFTRTGAAENKAVSIDKARTVKDNQIVGSLI